MGNQRTSGLTNRGGVWHIDKQYRGVRICESTGASSVAEAEEVLAKRMTAIREANLHGLRPCRTFRAAATKYLKEYGHKKSIKDDAGQLKLLDPMIGSVDLSQVHMGTLQAFKEKRLADGVKTKTLNAGFAVVRRILNLAASEWMDESGMTWLETAPKIKLLPVKDGRPPYPLSHEEQTLLFQELPSHLATMALYKVNVGCREQEVCGLRWEHEVKVPELDTMVFVIPADNVKNGEERLVVLNDVAKSVVESQRGLHPTHVFAFATKHGKRRPLTKMYNTAWKSARERAADEWMERHGESAPAGFRKVRVHDLKHTFGRRLRAAGVTFEDRQDLLGHKSGRITTHYSQSELSNLIEAANKACEGKSRKTPATSWLRRRITTLSA
jgi:integrase